jgi:hypothetical protein
MMCCFCRWSTDFRGEWIDSHIDGSKVRYYPSSKRYHNIRNSVLVVASLILLVVGIVVSIYIIRYTIVSDVGETGAQGIASLLNAIQIQVMNQVYSTIALKYTEKENHRSVNTSGTFRQQVIHV